MNEYRVSFWIENEGDIPDLYFHIRTNAAPEPDTLIKAALLLSGKWWVREAEVSRLMGSRWSVVGAVSGVSLRGLKQLSLCW